MAFVFSSRRRHTRFDCDWSSDVCSSDLSVSVLCAIAIAECRHQSPVRLTSGGLVMRVFATFSWAPLGLISTVLRFSPRDHTLPRDCEGIAIQRVFQWLRSVYIFIYMDVFVVVTHSVSVLCAIAIAECRHQSPVRLTSGGLVMRVFATFSWAPLGLISTVLRFSPRDHTLPRD